jgi:hypothetical protein
MYVFPSAHSVEVNEGPVLLQKLIHEISVGNEIEGIKQLISEYDTITSFVLTSSFSLFFFFFFEVVYYFSCIISFNCAIT